MAFVKVVGGTEIYNFRIQSFMHFYTKFWSLSISNQGSAKHLGPNATALQRRARTRRASRRPLRPRLTPPKAARRPRLTLLHVPCLEAIGVLPAVRTPRTTPYWLSARRGLPVRRRRPAVRALVEARYHGRISAVTLPSPRPSRPYKWHAFSPPHADISAPPRHPRCCRRAAPPCFPRPSNRPCPSPRPYRTFTCHLLSRMGSCRRRSRAAVAAAAGPRRAPTPANSPPQLRLSPGPR
jgi:hypothetical protein